MNKMFCMVGVFSYLIQMGGKGRKMEQKGMTFDYDFCYFILLFSSLFLGGKRNGEWSSKNRDQKSYLTVPSFKDGKTFSFV